MFGACYLMRIPNFGLGGEVKGWDTPPLLGLLFRGTAATGMNLGA